MIDEGDCGAIGGMKIGRGNRRENKQPNTQEKQKIIKRNRQKTPSSQIYQPLIP
jgi:hypothetical protein